MTFPSSTTTKTLTPPNRLRLRLRHPNPTPTLPDQPVRPRLRSIRFRARSESDFRKALIDRDEIHSGTPKRSRLPSSGGSGDYRKDREEWSDTAIGCLLEAYSEKFVQLNRGNLRGRDWEEVAAMVSERCENQTKSVEQCKNKVDNLKKRYKLERHRLSSGGVAASHWPWFKQMEQIVGNSLAAKAAAEEEKSSVGVGASYSARQSKRLGTSINSTSVQINNAKLKPSNNLRRRRVVFKISGAALAGSAAAPNNVDPKVAMLIAKEVSLACFAGVEVAIVVGGRNFFCGDSWVTSGFDRCTAYQIGMMAMKMNSILLQSTLEKADVQAHLQSAFSMPEVAEPYSRQRAKGKGCNIRWHCSGHRESNSSPQIKLQHLEPLRWMWATNVAIYFNQATLINDGDKNLWGWNEEDTETHRPLFPFSKLCSLMHLPLTVPRRLTILLVDEENWSKVWIHHG
ncbi:uncharacterized protein LOC127265245 [Andrographis paniculata]|uniref:uncharacterized protein LOC127265245 n=1 Tax=Andrographis paniculata TaxID=175694 RepID=UPI0021E705D1|nr:uncharacterized protein LOC127265245 [Andrographis paniculata]